MVTNRKDQLYPYGRVDNIACCYCKFFHTSKSKEYERTCGKGYRVNVLSNPCTHYKQRKYYFCPVHKEKTTSIQCIAFRSCGFEDCMFCQYFSVKKPKQRTLVKRKR